MGVTKLRLARFGCRNRPFYRIVAIDSRKFREAAPLEYLGTYDPLPYSLDGAKEVRLKVDRIKYWLSVGAQTSDRVAYLLWRAGLAPVPPIRFSPQQSKSKQVPKDAPQAAGFHTLSAAAHAAIALGGGMAHRRAGLSGAPLFSSLASFSGAFTRPSCGTSFATTLR